MYRVFLVDDRVDVVEGIMALVPWESLGCVAVGSATNGRDAYERIDAKQPDIIITDIKMPVMDGLAATRAIRELPRPDARTVPIIAMTANAFEEDRRQAGEAGMNGYLTKPVDMQALLQELQRYL